MCNSSANCQFKINSISLAPLEVLALEDLFARRAADVLPKYLQTIEVIPNWYPSYFGFLAIFHNHFIHLISSKQNVCLNLF